MATIFTLYAGFNSDNGNTVDENMAILLGLLNKHFSDGYTFNEVVGMYEGQGEPSVIVTLICTDDTPTERAEYFNAVYRVAADYKRDAAQETVWVTHREESLGIF